VVASWDYHRGAKIRVSVRGNPGRFTHPLSLTCYHGDRHEALFRGSVHPVFDLVKCLCEVPYGKALTETSTPFVALPVVLMSGVLVVVSFVCGYVGRQLVC
jgi:hypothetical protein